MVKDELVINTNPYLKDRKKLAEGICRMVESSSAIEGIYVKVQATAKNGGYQYSVTSKPNQKI